MAQTLALQIENQKSKIENRKPLLAFCLTLTCAAAGAYDISGTVTGADNAPVAGAKLWLWQEFSVRTAETDDAGAYVFRDVPPGPTRLIARREGMALDGSDFQLIKNTELPLKMAEAAPVALRIVNQEFQPVPGASVKTVGIEGGFTVPVMELAKHGFPSWRADADGLVTVPDVPRGAHFSVTLYHPEYAESHLPYLPPSEKQKTLQLFPGTPLQGRVYSPEKEALPGARVYVYRLTAAGRRDYGDQFTDPEGYYNILVAPGEYYLDVRHPDHASPLARQGKVGQDPVTVDVALLEPCRLAGRILTPDGSPVPGVAVRYYIDNRFYAEQFTRHDGAYELTVPTGQGALRVVSPPGHITAHRGDIPVQLDHPVRVDIDPFRLKPLPVIEGIVVGPDGAPQPNVLVGTLEASPAFWLITDRYGAFRIQLTYPPEEGKASFRAEHGLRFLRKDFEVDLRENPGPLRLVLEEFEPDLSRKEFKPEEKLADDVTDLDTNDLSGLLDLKAPELAVDHWVNSNPLTLDALKGKVVVMTLWAGFDEIGPTRDRMYEMCALHALLKDVGDVAFLGIHDNGSEPDEIRKFVEAYGIKFPVARDLDDFTTFERYNTRVIPQTVLIDKHGRVRYVEVKGRLLELIKSLRREN